MVTRKTSCPLCRTELKPKNSVYHTIYDLPSDQYHRFNSSRIDPVTLDLGIGLDAIMTEPGGYNVEDSIVFGRELIDEGLRFGRRIDEELRLSLETLRNMPLETQPQQQQGVTLRRRENASELRIAYRNMIDRFVHSPDSVLDSQPASISATADNSSDDDEDEMYSPHSLGGDLYDEEAYMREVSLYM